jgi:hypothetical protein
MRRLQWLALGTAALAMSSVAFGAVPKRVTASGTVQAVSSTSITVAGTTCVMAPTNPRMMMPTIIRDISVGDSASITCARLNGRLVLVKFVEKPAGAVVVRGIVNAVTGHSITVRGVTCEFNVVAPPNPRMMMPTFIRGDLALLACLRAEGNTGVTAFTELKPHPGQVVLVSGDVSGKTATSVTVSGLTCSFAGTGSKPLPGMPTFIKNVDVGDHVLVACTLLSGHFVLTGVGGR